MPDRPVLPSLPCDPSDIPRLRVGRRVPQHVYLMAGGHPDDVDMPLFTCPAPLAQMLVDGLEALRWLNLHPAEEDSSRG